MALCTVDPGGKKVLHNRRVVSTGRVSRVTYSLHSLHQQHQRHRVNSGETLQRNVPWLCTALAQVGHRPCHREKDSVVEAADKIEAIQHCIGNTPDKIKPFLFLIFCWMAPMQPKSLPFA